MEQYNPQAIEKKWQKIWEEKKIYSPNISAAKRPYYNLWMFPYPSGEGLHVGHFFASTGSDIRGRFMRMRGNNVFQPIGYDAFGIHSENYAIKAKIHPQKIIEKTTKRYEGQLKQAGHGYDWERTVNTSHKDYYKWTQWIFLQLFKAGLAYRKKAPVNWCPSCKTVLADEQVISGKCERCDAEVLQKETEQWFLGITKYAERLLNNLDKIGWPETTKAIQKNWIGKSEGTLIKFPIVNSMLEIDVFTTRPDTLFGATYMVLAPEHPVIQKLKSNVANFQSVEKYIEASNKKSEDERIDEKKEKTGVELKGVKAINPVNLREISVWVADYVLGHYGTGAVMAVPCHDQRDFDFAVRYNLPMIEVIKPKIPQKIEYVRSAVISDGRFHSAYEGEGILTNSSGFDGLNSEIAKDKIIEWLSQKGFGEKKVFYKLRDWLISRQRYWGAPIPIIYCDKCGEVAASEKDLPVELPYIENFRPTGSDKSPLASCEKFINVKCPICKCPAKRETDVSDTFLDSAWYFLRYPSVNFDNKPFDKKITKKWLPVDMYIGGQEHAVLHLMYSRFVTMALKDLGFIDFEEPYKKFRAHGLLTKNGAKMSKSRGNVVNPDEYCKKYGADTLRIYLMFLGPFEQGGDWQDLGISGAKRFLEKVWNMQEKIKTGIKNQEADVILHKTIKNVTEDIENLRYNTAVSSLMILVNEISKLEEIPAESYRELLKLLAPFAPHMTEELWQKINGKKAKTSIWSAKKSIHFQKWPEYDLKLIKEKKIALIVQVNGKMREIIEADADIAEEKAKELAISSKKIKNWIEGKKIKKVIFVPGKLINIVV